MTRVLADGVARVIAPEQPAGGPLRVNRAAAEVLAELELWAERFLRGELEGHGSPMAPGERFAVARTGVRAAGGGQAATTGALHATDRRVRVLARPGATAREWPFTELADVCVLGNWGGLALVRPGGETELLVAASPQPPSWRDAAAWLKVEGAFAAAAARLEPWLGALAPRLAADGAL